MKSMAGATNMEANVTIITKYGFKKPSLVDLAVGELGVDLLNKVLYTRDTANQIIEVGGGSIDWSQIDPDSIPDSITNIIDGTINLEQLVGIVGDNSEAIVKLDADLKDLAAVVAENTRLIGVNAGGISDNADAIDGLNTRVGTAEGKILKNEGDITAVEVRLDDAEPKIQKNIDDIAALQKVIDGDLTGLYLGGTYRLPDNKVEDVTEAGTLAGIKKNDDLGQHAKEDNKGMYFVIEGTGTLGGLFRTSSNGQIGQNGDWLVCDGIHGWILMSFGGDHVAWGSIGGNIENQTDLQEALAMKLEEGDTLDGGKFQ
jgi:hypothetical protein